MLQPILSKSLRFRRFSAKSSEFYYKSWQKDIGEQGQNSFMASFTLPKEKAAITQLLQALVRMKGNVADYVPSIVIPSVCHSFSQLPFEGKQDFLVVLSKFPCTTDDSNPFPTILQSLEKLASSPDQQYKLQQELRQALVPLHEIFFQLLVSDNPNGLLFLIQLRADLLQILRKRLVDRSDLVGLRYMDWNLKRMLASWFQINFLHLERITFETTPGSLLEKIIRYEAVHPVGTIQELKRRLGPGRRCYGFFHPSLPQEPLVFVHVALVPGLAPSLDYINDNTGIHVDEANADTAIFYSISATQPGLSGVDLGNFLIKQVAKTLKQELKQIQTFSTLSPIPQLVPWLRTRIAAVKNFQGVANLLSEAQYQAIVNAHSIFTDDTSPCIENCEVDGLKKLVACCEVKDWHLNDQVTELLRPVLVSLAAHYLYKEKKRKQALCPVANFHLRNGARFERLNWLADTSPKGMTQSAGLMVNYKYDLEQVEKNNESYVLHHEIAIGSSVKQWLE